MIDLSKLSQTQLDKFFHMQAIVSRQEDAAARVRALREYYDGNHPVYLTQRQQEFIGDLLSEGKFDFAHNTVRSVIDTLRERLNVSGFSINGVDTDEAPDAPEAQLAALFWQWWQENRFDAQQIRLHRRAIRDGLSYVMVSYDKENQRPLFTLHQVDDGTTGITCHRDPENPDVILYMCKYWYTYNPLKPGETGTQRKNVYLPGEVRKYIMGKTDWLRMDGSEAPLEEGDARWPLPWVDRDNVPLGISIIEFENPGGSEVAQIIGLQDALNKSWLDLIAAADASGFPILVNEEEPATSLLGPDDDDDIDGDDELFVAPGRMIETTGHIHRIEGANLEQLINVIHLIVETIAGISRTPQYYLRPADDNSSGEALKQRDSGLVKRAEERQLIFGQAWADVIQMAYKVQQAFGPGQLPEVPEMKVTTLWDSAETRDDKSNAETAQIHKALSVPDEEIWAMLGYDPQQIAKWKATKRSDDAVKLAQVAQTITNAQRQQQAQPNGNGVPVANGANTPVTNGRVGNGVNGNGVQQA